MNAFVPVIKARHVNKRYGQFQALKNVNFSVAPGQILGLIGPNGAGKTTLLKGLLGLTSLQGDLQVLGKNPKLDRTRLLEQVSFIADTAIMPRWLKVQQALDYVAAVHPHFRLEKAQAFLAKTNIRLQHRVSQLSKGMVTQLHLALVMAIDSKLLVLDEPTLGLDIVFRKQFYSNLLNDYFDGEKTIIITTHQVEEVENILTDIMFIDRGEVILQSPVDALEQQFTQVAATLGAKEKLLSEGFCAIGEQPRLGGVDMIFEGVDREMLAQFGSVRTPTIADLFVAKMRSAGEGN